MLPSAGFLLTHPEDRPDARLRPHCTSRCKSTGIGRKQPVAEHSTTHPTNQKWQEDTAQAPDTAARTPSLSHPSVHSTDSLLLGSELRCGSSSSTAHDTIFRFSSE
ncbi:unnamed protein product [Zymoseptoria tritici ST99CH_3D7]|uniref:Uncharacterized protein n=1 Tax=Zymoseptoria tritici (strain ST99CH_3D7) TaxID=1276538 RepID=A0A1X7S0B9_ZYMT9|nr:unnamed protein product [Zymoseptoria tritici ST99CH_3D7]